MDINIGIITLILSIACFILLICKILDYMYAYDRMKSDSEDIDAFLTADIILGCMPGLNLISIPIITLFVLLCVCMEWVANERDKNIKKNVDRF